ncbi:MAG: 4'-phosphopantetheinyl transferase [Gammaproteobacteria bacterium]|nr:MAG: 4'-phosphopantetheinyl transferase [Gammaproteobacteria bacterium]RLA53964.1 MAG: 4'-phosphopantetheinyl transferase [Gammaproteobacteria bacterium]
MIDAIFTDNPFAVAETCFVACRYSADRYAQEQFKRYGVQPPTFLERAQPKRAVEYLAGRYCAQRALQTLMGCEIPVGAYADRSPQWPEFVVGSITHSDNYAAAMVARKGHYSSIGIDCEPVFDSRAHKRLEANILSPVELERVDASPADRQQLITIIFSAKESIYKAIYPLTRRFMGFHDCEFLSVDNKMVFFTPSAALASGEGSEVLIVVHYVLQAQMVITNICATGNASYVDY